MVTLWDVRYHVPLSSWPFPGYGNGIDAMCAATPRGHTIEEQMTEPPLLYVSSGDSELGLLDARDGRCLEVIRVVSSKDPPGTATSSPRIIVKGSSISRRRSRISFSSESGWSPCLKAPLAGADDDSDPYLMNSVQNLQPLPRGAGMRALLPVHSGAIITAGSDRTIRMWNTVHPDESHCISSPEIANCTNTATTLRKSRVVCHDHCGARIVQELPTQRNGQENVKTMSNSVEFSKSAHSDTIQSLCITPAPQRLMLSAGRDGVIKVWK